MNKTEFNQWFDTLTEKEKTIVRDYMEYLTTCWECGGSGRISLNGNRFHCSYCDGDGTNQKESSSDYQQAIDAIKAERVQDKINQEAIAEERAKEREEKRIYRLNNPESAKWEEANGIALDRMKEEARRCTAAYVAAWKQGEPRPREEIV